MQELEQAIAQELEYESGLHPRIRIRYVKNAKRALEMEAFDPTPPPSRTILLTRFPTARATLSSAHLRIIASIVNKVVAKMKTLTAIHCITLEVEGHEDEIGDPAIFGYWGRERAKAVALRIGRVLSIRIRSLPAANLPRVIIEVSSAGPTRPIRSNVTSDGRALNRRVEVRGRAGICPDVT